MDLIWTSGFQPLIELYHASIHVVFSLHASIHVYLCQKTLVSSLHASIHVYFCYKTFWSIHFPSKKKISWSLHNITTLIHFGVNFPVLWEYASYSYIHVDTYDTDSNLLIVISIFMGSTCTMLLSKFRVVDGAICFPQVMINFSQVTFILFVQLCIGPTLWVCLYNMSGSLSMVSHDKSGL